MSSTSASRCAAIANPSRTSMPLEYVLHGTSMNSPSSLKARSRRYASTISARQAVQRALSRMFSRPVKSRPKPAPSSSSVTTRQPHSAAPAVERHDPGERAQRRRLAGAVAPTMLDGLAGLDAQRRRRSSASTGSGRRVPRRRAAAPQRTPAVGADEKSASGVEPISPGARTRPPPARPRMRAEQRARRRASASAPARDARRRAGRRAGADAARCTSRIAAMNGATGLATQQVAERGWRAAGCRRRVEDRV